MGRAQILARAMNFRCCGDAESGSARPSDEDDAAAPAPGAAADAAAAAAAAEAAALEGAMKTVAPVIRCALRGVEFRLSASASPGLKFKFTQH